MGGLATLARDVAEEHHPERRRDGDRHHDRRHDREQVRRRDRGQERSRLALHEERGQQHGGDDQGREEDRAPHLERRLDDDLPRGCAVALLALTADPLCHVVDVDHGVVDQDDQSHHQARQDHRVHGRIGEVQDQPGGCERHRDRYRADEGGAPIEEERSQDQDQQDRPDQRRAPEVVEGRVDELGRTVDRRVHRETGKTGRELVECPVDSLRHLRRVGVGELLDHEQQAVSIGAEGISDQGLVIHDDVGDVTERLRRTTRSDLALRILDRHLLQLVGRRDRLLVEDVEPFVQGVDEPTGAGGRGLEEGERGDLQSVAGGPDDLVERDVRVAETLRIDKNLQLPVSEPPGRDVRDPFDPEQSRSDHPLGQDGHLDRRELVRRQLHHRDAARRGDGLDHLRRPRNLRETSCRDRLGQTLTDDLASVEHVGARLEGHDHRRKARQRDRLDLFEERDAHEQVLLEGHRDQLLDLLCGEPEGLRLHLDGGPLEFGQDVRAGVVQLQNAVDEEPDGNRDHQTTELDTRADDPPHHGCSTSTSRSRGHPGR